MSHTNKWHCTLVQMEQLENKVQQLNLVCFVITLYSTYNGNIYIDLINHKIYIPKKTIFGGIDKSN